MVLKDGEVIYPKGHGLQKTETEEKEKMFFQFGASTFLPFLFFEGRVSG